MSIVVNDWVLVAEIVPGRRRWDAPLEGSSVPRIGGSGLAVEPAVNKGEEKNELSRAGDQCGDSNETGHRHERGHEIVDERRIAPDITHQPPIMEPHENAVNARESDPEKEPS